MTTNKIRKTSLILINVCVSMFKLFRPGFEVGKISDSTRAPTASGRFEKVVHYFIVMLWLLFERNDIDKLKSQGK